MQGSYDWALAALSVLIAIVSSYGALDLAGRVRQTAGRISWAWLAGGAFVVGVGFWSMHFVGVLALILPIWIGYDPYLTFLSLLAALATSGFALTLVSRERLTPLMLCGGGWVTGAGLCMMHYLGLDAMRIQAELTYDPILFCASAAVSIITSTSALWLAFKLRGRMTSRVLPSKISAAVLMGVAIAAMHFVGVAAVRFTPQAFSTAATGAGIHPPTLGISISIAVLCALGVSILASTFDAQLVRRAQHEKKKLQAADITLRREIGERRLAEGQAQLSEASFQILFEQAADGIVVLSATGRCLNANKRLLVLTGLKASDVIGEPVAGLVAPAHRERVPKELQNVLRGKPYQSEWLVQRRDGSSFPGEISANLLSDGRVLIVLREITERKSLEAELRDSEEKYRAVLETTGDGVLLVDVEQRIFYVNSAAERIFGYGEGDLVGRPLSVLQPERYRVRHAHLFERRLLLGEKLSRTIAEFHGLRRDGSEFPMELALSEVKIGEHRMFAGFVRDVSEKRMVEERMGRLQRIHAVLSSVNHLIVHTRHRQQLLDGICRIAAEQGGLRFAWIGGIVDGSIVALARAGHDSGYLDTLRISTDPDTPTGRGPAASSLRTGMPVVVGDVANAPVVLPWREQLMGRGVQSLAAIPVTAGDNQRYTLNLYSTTPDFFTEGEMALLKDLAEDVAYGLEFIEREERLEYLAYYDSMTRLPNRFMLLERLDRSIQAARSEQRSLAVMKIDIQAFRSINEAAGRSGGDQVLTALAARLLQFAEGYGYAARTGGDRFALVLDRSGEASDPSMLVERHLAPLLAGPISAAGQTFHVATRVGVARFPEDGDDAETLAHNADAALKKAKTAGERLLFYSRKMGEAMAERLSLESRLPAAVEGCEFVLYYQPKIDLRSGAIAGAEALIRWQSPELGLVPPSKFISLLEESGQIIDVGRWAMQQALRDYQAWKSQGLPVVPLAVNVSALQLRQSDFIDSFRSVFAQGSAAPAPLEIEITESTLMGDVDSHIEKLEVLRGLGISIGIDDFGTGYSSLAYLARLPIDSLKIDRSFVARMGDSADTMGIVSTIMSLAHSMKLKVVAEGVESEEQLRFLRLLRCDQVQGWFYSKALPAEAFAQLLREGGSWKKS